MTVMTLMTVIFDNVLNVGAYPICRCLVEGGSRFCLPKRRLYVYRRSASIKCRLRSGMQRIRRSNATLTGDGRNRCVLCAVGEAPFGLLIEAQQRRIGGTSTGDEEGSHR